MNSNENADPKRPVNYVFVDYENMHELDPELIGRKTVHLTLLLGAQQKKLDSTLVQKLVAHSASVELVQLNSPGRNALDFALAFYLGKAAQADPTAYFHIVTKDTGFDPLVEHLRSCHIRTQRHDDYTTLTFTSHPKMVAESPDELFARVTTHLRNNVKNRPKQKKTLESHLSALCGKAASANAVHELIDKLWKRGYLTIGEKDAVTYQLDGK